MLTLLSNGWQDHIVQTVFFATNNHKNHTGWGPLSRCPCVCDSKRNTFQKKRLKRKCRFFTRSFLRKKKAFDLVGWARLIPAISLCGLNKQPGPPQEAWARHLTKAESMMTPE